MGSVHSSPINRRPEDGGRPQLKPEVVSSKAKELPAYSGSIYFQAMEDDRTMRHRTVPNETRHTIGFTRRLPTEIRKPKKVTPKDAPKPAIAKERDCKVTPSIVLREQEPTFKSWNKLAPEIRVMILKAYLAMPTPIQVASKTGAIAEVPSSRSAEFRDKYNVRGPHISQKQICEFFLVSKTMYAEAIPAYFGINTFNFKSTNDFVRFAGRLCPTYRWQVRKISISWTGTSKVDAAKALRTFVGLRELKLDQVTLFRFKTGKKVVDAFGKVVKAKLKTYAQKELLSLRGLKKLRIEFKESVLDRGKKRPCTQINKISFRRRFRAIKSRQDEKMLQRQHAKDFPVS